MMEDAPPQTVSVQVPGVAEPREHAPTLPRTVTPNALEAQHFTARRAEAERRTQALLDRFAEHNLPITYPEVVNLSMRLMLRNLIEEGRMTEDEAVAREFEIQAQLLEISFQHACTARDEQHLAQPPARLPLATPVMTPIGANGAKISVWRARRPPIRP